MGGIKNPDKIHMLVRAGKWQGRRYRYLCIGTCGITKSKSTHNRKEVTCKNCKKKLKWLIWKK